MRKLSKADEAKFKQLFGDMLSIKSQHDELINSLDKDVQALVSKFNLENDKLFSQMKEQYESIVDQLKAFASDKAQEMDAYISDRTDKWHDSDAGFTYRYWQEEWQDISDEFAEAACVDFDIEINFQRLPEIEEPRFKPSTNQ